MSDHLFYVCTRGRSSITTGIPGRISLFLDPVIWKVHCYGLCSVDHRIEQEGTGFCLLIGGRRIGLGIGGNYQLTQLPYIKQIKDATMPL